MNRVRVARRRLLGRTLGGIAFVIPLSLAPAARSEQAPGLTVQGASPHINRPFEGTDLERWATVFERPGREVFDQRFGILQAARIQPGMRVADIGAGSGLFATLFARAVGPSGLVYAVDVSPGFVSAIAERARAERLTNVVPLLNTQQGAGLDGARIDLAFVCDTYHHFEDPKAMLKSIHRALVPGGAFILIDYHRRPGQSSPWILSHVRAGRDQVVREVTGAGFRLVEEPDFLRESFFLRFEKADRPTP
jgi:SAM-dependent methyltransferase